MMTILPKCRRCGGAFYPDPFPGSYRHNYCDDCVDIAAAESLERMKETYIQPTPRYRWKPFYERYPNWREMIAEIKQIQESFSGKTFTVIDVTD